MDATPVQFSSRLPFSDWPNREVPLVSAGIYAIWRGQQLFYCGMSGRSLGTIDLVGKKKYGLTTRLASHASGRLSGDQFCVYVANRVVVPALTPEDQLELADGAITLDQLTKQFIREHLDYQYTIVNTGKEAFDLEKLARNGGLFGSKPFLNPL